MHHRSAILAGLVVVSFAAPSVANAQFVIEGVIHETTSLEPLEGVAVFMVDALTDEILSPGSFDDPSQQGRVTGADGRYRFDVTRNGLARITLERPDARFAFPSVLRPPGGTACTDVPCPANQINVSATPTAEDRHALLFNVMGPGGALNNHLPVDRLDELITVELDASRQRVQRGQNVVFTATFESRSSEPIDDYEIALAIPKELRMIDGSIGVLRRSTTSESVPFTVRQDDLVMRVGPLTLGPGERLELRAGARLVTLPDRSRAPVQTWLERPGGIVVSRRAEVQLTIEGDPLLDNSSILGRVFCDTEEGAHAGWQDEGERGLFGARVYLDTGFYAESDRNGLFHFSGVPPGTHLLKIDDQTVAGELTSPQRVQIYLSPGTPAKTRFAVKCAQDEWRLPTKVDVKTTTVTGPPPVGPRTVQVRLATKTRALDIAGRTYHFAKAKVEVVEREDGARVFLTGSTPYTVTRWRLYIDEIGPDGKVIRVINDPAFTATGPAPLFVDWQWDRRPAGVYRASLELRADDLDVVRSKHADFGAIKADARPPTDPASLNLLTTLAIPEETGAIAGVEEITRESHGHILLVGHWDASDDADLRARVLAERVRDELLQRGVDRAAIEVISDGASHPIVPSISARLRKKNRRVDVRVGPARPPAPVAVTVPQPRKRSAGLLLSVDNKSGEVPLERWSDVDVTMDLDTPATISATLRDKDGTTSMMRRIVTHDWVTRAPEYAPAAVVLSTERNALTIADTKNVDLTAYELELGAVGIIVNPDTVIVQPSPTSRTPLAQWTLQLRSAAGEMLAEASGEGAVNRSASLVTTSTAVFGGPTTLVFRGQFPGGAIATRRSTLPAMTRAVPAIRLTAGAISAAAIEPILTQARASGWRLRLAFEGPEDGPRAQMIDDLSRVLDAAGIPQELLTTTSNESGAFGATLLTQYAGRVESAAEPTPATLQLDGTGVGLDGPIDPIGRTVEVVGTTTVRLPLPEFPEHPRSAPPSRPTNVVATAENVPAADVVMTVAPSGATRSRLRFPIHGTTRPSNVVRINGTEVPVDADGAFVANVDLKPGDNTVRVQSVDELGNTAIFERKVTTSSSGWFLLAMGDAQIGLGGTRLAGSNGHTHTDAGPLSLDGRAVAYGRARVALDGPFKQIEVVGRLDTAQLGDPTVTRLEDDPLRLLPAFGDESVEVQETASRYKIDLSIRADDAKLAVGNRTTTIEGFGGDSYFNFRRAGFGVHADVDKRFGKNDRTEITGVVAFENDGTRRGHDELLGTGGTMYWLSNRDLVEGAERVRLVVRDRDTGQTLDTVEKMRGVDYEIRPHEGRIVFREPVSQGLSLAQTAINRTLGQTGHAIYIVVDYSYLSDGVDKGTFGVEAKETIYDQFEIYGAAAGETNLEGQHRLYGVGLAYRPTDGSYVEFEYAHSSGETSAGRLSTDGGLSYLDFDLSLRPASVADLQESDGPFFGALDSNAFGLGAQLAIADLFASRPVEDRPTGYVRAYGRKAGLKFSSLGAARQSGRLEAGIAATYDLTPSLAAHASFDAAVFVTPGAIPPLMGADLDGTFRGLLNAGVTYRNDQHGMGFEFVHLHTDPLPLPGPASSTGVSASYDRKIAKDLTLTLGADALVATDAITRSDIGVLGTSVGFAYQLSKHLELSLLESLRFNGDNATQLGIRVRGEDGFSSYVAERFGRAGGAAVVTTVLGAEDYVAEGSRTYGELQLGSGAHHSTTRAVLGMDNRWRVADGVDLLLAYERAHLLSDGVVPEAGGVSPYAAPFGGLAATLGGFGAPVQILPGSVSRDALAGGITYTGLPNLKLSTRLELRLDNGDQSTGGRDFRVVGGHAGAAWKLTRDVTALGRLSFTHVTDTIREVTYAKALEGSVGAAFRPRTEDWFTLIVRYTRLDQQRPRSLEDDRRLAETRDAFSIEPIIDTPWNVQLVERVALVASRTEASDLGSVSGVNILWINRVNVRPVPMLEGGIEYRMLFDMETETAERGFLVEAGYLPNEYVRIGLGYNFSRFSDDVLTATADDAAGPFLRVTARY